MRAVKNLISELPETHQRNFALVDFIDKNGDNQPSFDMNRDGFMLLVMGFTGKKALSFKLAYIDQFNAMETALTVPQIERKTISPEQQRFIQESVNEIVHRTGKPYQTIYHELKTQFQVGTYKDATTEQFPAMCKMLGVVYTGEFIAATDAPKAIEQPTIAPTLSPTVTINRTDDWHNNFKQGQESVNEIRNGIITGNVKVIDNMINQLKRAQLGIYKVEFCGDGMSVGVLDMISRYAAIGMQSCKQPLIANFI